MTKLRISLFAFLFIAAGASLAQTSKTIGALTWDTKNLDVTTFANGEKIYNARTAEEWIQAGKEGKPAWCYYENDPGKGKTYGVLYNWYAVSDPRGLAPKGWHVPTKYEWLPMLDALGGKEVAGNKLKSTTLWEAVSGTERNGDNTSGFSGLPGGLRFIADGKFDDLGTRCQFWTATKNDSGSAAIVVLGINNPVQVAIAKFGFGYSVRCVMD